MNYTSWQSETAELHEYGNFENKHCQDDNHDTRYYHESRFHDFFTQHKLKGEKPMAYTNRQLRNIANVICEHYRLCRRKMESLEKQNAVALNMDDYRDALNYVTTIDRTLQDCSNDTRLIITQGFLNNGDPGWYDSYYSRNTYYRLRKKAVSEFLNGLRV